MNTQGTQRLSENELSKIILGSSLKAHRNLRPGLLESACQKCLAFELDKQNLLVKVEKPLPLVYEDVHLEAGSRIDIFVKKKKLLLKLKQLRP